MFNPNFHFLFEDIEKSIPERAKEIYEQPLMNVVSLIEDKLQHWTFYNYIRLSEKHMNSFDPVEFELFEEDFDFL